MNLQNKIEGLLINNQFDQIYRMYLSLFDADTCSIEEVKLFYLGLMNNGKFDEVKNMIESLIDKDSLDKVSLYFLYSHFLFLNNDLDDAEKYLAMINNIDPDFMPAKYFQLTISALEGNTSKESCNELLKKYPEDKYIKFFYCLASNRKADKEYMDQLNMLKELDLDLANVLESDNPIEGLPMVFDSIFST